MRDRGSLRDIDSIQEKDGEGSGKLGSLILASIGTACVVFAAVALLRRPGPEPQKATDPLDDLLARQPVATARRELSASDVTFPQILSDDDKPTTALAAIQGPGANAPAGSGYPFVLPPGSPTIPPMAGDRLPVVPMPAQRVLGATPVVTEPRDALTAAARDRETAATSGPMAEPGHAGAFVLQVASFKTEGEAQSFVNVLRQRGHHAYTEAATIAGRGMWHRVRVGPFKTGREATKYRSEFEAKEHLVPFILEAEKEKHLAEVRETEKRTREAKRHR